MSPLRHVEWRATSNALRSMVVDPSAAMDEVSLLTDAERAQLVDEWNATALQAGQAACLHALVAAQADRTPDAVAVVCEADHLSYRELDRGARQLAHYLHGLGVRRGPDRHLAGKKSRVNCYDPRWYFMPPLCTSRWIRQIRLSG